MCAARRDHDVARCRDRGRRAAAHGGELVGLRSVRPGVRDAKHPDSRRRRHEAGRLGRAARDDDELAISARRSCRAAAKSLRLCKPIEARVHTNAASSVVTINAATPDERTSDSIPDAIDNCPTTPNPTQANTDGMGLGDACSGSVDGGACGTPIIALHAGGPTVGDFIDDTTPPILWNAGTPYTAHDAGSVDTSAASPAAHRARSTRATASSTRPPA